MTKRTDRRRDAIRVVHMLADPSARTGRAVDNPYAVLLVDSLPAARIRSRYFRWRGLLVDGFDVLHVHWPEVSLHHPTRGGRAVKAILFAAFLTRVRLQRKAVVRTVHNLQPHEPTGQIQARLIGHLDRLTTLWIVLNPATPTPDQTRTVLIPHGHYRTWYRERSDVPTVAGRLLSFGMIRPYKGIEELIVAFRGVPTEAFGLRVVGEPRDTATAERLAELAGADTRIGLELRFVDDDALIAEIMAAEIVVLPYRALHNSGAALLALSYGKPVIVPSNDATEQLAQEFGREWVATYPDELDAARLDGMIASVRSSRRDAAGPDMSRREWGPIGLLHADAYEAACQLTGGRRRTEPVS